MPQEALREAILNCVVHKAYESSTPIQIAVYDDKLEIWNCGILPEDWTIDNLLGKHRSRPYNPDIANTFFRAGEIEAWGRGIERIIEACKNANTPEPEFKYDGGGLWTTFYFSKEYQEGIFGISQETIQKTIQKLTKQQQDILSYFIEHPKATRNELCENIPDATMGGIIHNLTRLQELNVLKRVGGRKKGFWQVIE